jgi:transposase-like protein
MGMMGCWRRSRTCLRPHLVSDGRSHKQRNILNAIPRRERGDVQPELVGIWGQPTKQEALLQLAAFKAKYGKRYRGSGTKLG